MKNPKDCKKEQLAVREGRKLFECREPKEEHIHCQIGFNYGNSKLCWEKEVKVSVQEM